MAITPGQRRLRLALMFSERLVAAPPPGANVLLAARRPNRAALRAVGPGRMVPARPGPAPVPALIVFTTMLVAVLITVTVPGPRWPPGEPRHRLPP